MSSGNHRRYVDEQDRRAEASARPLIRLVKAWKHFNNVPISSFYLELVSAHYVAQQSPIMYGHALGDLFTGFLQGQLAPFTDPTGVCGAVLPVRHVFDQAVAMQAVAQAAALIEEARAAARANRLEHSMRLWERLYNGGFAA